MGEQSYEYIIKQKAEGEALKRRIMLLLGYLIFAGVLLTLILTLSPSALFIPLLMIAAAVTALFIFITWRFVCVEYEVIISAGELMITVIYGKGFRKQILNLPVLSFSEIGEYDDVAYEAVSALSLQKNYVCLSSLSAPDVYYALFEEGKDQCILYFDAPARAVELLKKQNSGAFRASARRMTTGRKDSKA